MSKWIQTALLGLVSAVDYSANLHPAGSQNGGIARAAAGDCSDRDGYCDDGVTCKSIYVYTGNDSEEEIYACSTEDALKQVTDNAIENYMENDDLGQMMLELEEQLQLRERNAASSGEAMNPDDISALGMLRKFKNLKAMVMTLQPVNVTVFGRYCYYGCWCLPNGMHNLAAGYGPPVDEIDAACKEFALCYKCLEIDFGGACDPEARAYRWGRERFNGIPIDLKCKDEPDTGPTHRCKRYTCECDRVLAIGLGAFHWVWNESYHSRWGDFNRETQCPTGCTGGSCPPVDDCCGAYGSASTDLPAVTRRPYYSQGTQHCCQDVFFFDNVNKVCCDVGGTISVTEHGLCAGSTLDPDAVDDFTYAKK